MTELTPAQEEELRGLRLALEQEFSENESTQQAKSAKQDLVELKGDMLDALSRALKHGTIQQQANVAMWGYGKLLDEGKADNDPIRALIAGMPAPTSTTPTTITTTTEDAEPTEEAVAKAVDVPLEVFSDITDTTDAE